MSRLQLGSIPQLNIEAPQELAGARARLASFDMERLRGVMQLVGLNQAGNPIRVVLLPESYPLAKKTPPPTAGYALPNEDLIVLFPARSPRYPHDTLEDVLHHEVAHVLMARASGGGELPLWFHEGLAVLGERTWGLEDQARLMRELVLVSRTPLGEVDAMFASDEGSKARAYNLATAFVRNLIERHGAGAPADILRRMRGGDTFERAFAATTGETVARAENTFWSRNRFWMSIGPFLTTTTALWMIVTLIALVAIIRRRQQRAARRKQWDEEEAQESEESRKSEESQES